MCVRIELGTTIDLRKGDNRVVEGNSSVPALIFIGIWWGTSFSKIRLNQMWCPLNRGLVCLSQALRRILGKLAKIVPKMML